MNMLNRKYYVSVVGGLGNQLFQYAEAKNSNSAAKTTLLNQFRKEPTSKLSRLEILDFNLKDISEGYVEFRFKKLFQVLHNLILRLSHSREKRRWLSRSIGTLGQKIIIQFLEIGIYRTGRIKAQPSIGFWPASENQITQETLQIGYFQHCSWTKNAGLVRELKGLKLRDESTSFKIACERFQKSDFLAVHMRFGDYLKENEFGIPDKIYYENSLTLHQSLREYEQVVVFTNDGELAKEKFSGITNLPTTFFSSSKGLSASENLELMRFAKGYVLANSTFSWWGAFLSYDQNPLVTYPSPWFSGMLEPSGLFPKEWVAVKLDHKH